MRGPGRNCRLKIAAHTHRQALQPIAFGDLRQHLEMWSTVFFLWRDAHQAHKRQSHRAAIRDKAIGRFRHYSSFLRFRTSIDLNENLRGNAARVGHEGFVRSSSF